MDGWLSDRPRQGHNLGPGSILGAKGKKRAETVKIGKQSEPSGKPARLGSARFALCLLTLSPPFSPATPLAYTLSLPLPFPAPLPLHGVYVVVQFYPWFKFYVLLFWGMVIYMMIMSLKQKKLKFEPQRIYKTAEASAGNQEFKFRCKPSSDKSKFFLARYMLIG